MFRCPDSDSEDSNWEALAGWTKKVLIRGNIQRNRAEVLEKLAFAVSECLEVIDEQELEEEEERQRALTGEKRKKRKEWPNQTKPEGPKSFAQVSRLLVRIRKATMQVFILEHVCTLCSISLHFG